MISQNERERFRYDAWREVASDAEVCLASVIASAVSCSLTDAIGIAGSVWNQLDPQDLQQAADALLLRPWIQMSDAGGYWIDEAYASRLRSTQSAEEPDVSRRIAELLIEREGEFGELSEAEAESWFARGRIAYYFAAIDVPESERLFAETFSTPAGGDSGVQRLWLSGLALRAEQLTERVRIFMRGFQEYKRGGAHASRKSFSVVIESPEADEFRAIALHLWSVGIRNDPVADARLQESVSLSRDLGLRENEILARNSLVYSLLEKGRPRSAVAESSRLAQVNLGEARAMGDDFLIAGCEVALTASRREMRTGRPTDDEMDVELKNLHDARDRFLHLGMPESAVGAVNQAACLLRDGGRLSDAILEILDASTDLKWSRPQRTALGLVKTLRSIERRLPASDTELKRKHTEATQSVDDWFRRFGLSAD
jgi:hypothetical protein